MRKAAAVLLSALVFPGSSFGGAGRAAVQSLTQPVSARPAALAEAYSAETAGADSLGYNPAGLALASRPELLVQYHGGFMGDTFLNAGYAQRAGNFGFGASVLSYNSGNVIMLNDYNEEISVAGQRDIAYSAGAGAVLPWFGLSAGLAVKMVSTQMIEEYTGRTLAGDAGIRLDVPESALSFAVAGQNMGAGIKVADGESNLPSIIRAGCAYRLEIEAEGSRMGAIEGILEPAMRPEPAPHRLLVLCDTIFRLGDRVSFLALGAEFSYHGSFAVRGGFRAPMHGTGNRNSVASLGIGAKIRRIKLDYAVEMTSNAGMHRVSAGFVF